MESKKNPETIPYIPHELFLEHIFPLLSIEDMGAKVKDTIQARSVDNLYFLVGRNKATVPVFILDDEKFSEEAGLTSMLPLLNDLGFKISKTLFTRAAREGNLYMLKWFLNKTVCRWDSKTFPAAVENGSLEVCTWLKEQAGCSWDAQTFFVAAGTGNLPYENGCPWNEQTFMAAALYKNLSMMKWLLQKKCPWDERTYYFALKNQNKEMLLWLQENNCPGVAKRN